jgi:hypothetical protein
MSVKLTAVFVASVAAPSHLGMSNRRYLSMLSFAIKRNRMTAPHDRGRRESTPQRHPLH